MEYVRCRDFFLSTINVPFFNSLNVEYFGIEGSTIIVENLKEKFPHLKNNLIASDFTKMIPFSGKFDLILDQVTLYDLAVEIQKNSESEFLVGGWKVEIDSNSEEEFDGKLIDWLLNQDELQLVNGKVIWIDKTRTNSPPLVLNDINISYHTSDFLSYLDRHLFYIDFYSSAGTKEKISLTGHFDADSIYELQKNKY